MFKRDYVTLTPSLETAEVELSTAAAGAEVKLGAVHVHAAEAAATAPEERSEQIVRIEVRRKAIVQVDALVVA